MSSYDETLSAQDKLSLSSRLVSCLSRYQIETISEQKTDHARITKLLELLLAAEFPAQDTTLINTRLAEITDGDLQCVLRVLNHYLGVRQIWSVLAASDPRVALIRELHQSPLTQPPAWFNPNAAFLRALKFLELHAEELFPEQASATRQNLSQFIPQPAPHSGHFAPGVVTFLGVFLPDQPTKSGVLRTIRAWWDFLQPPTTFYGKKCCKAVEFDTSTPHFDHSNALRWQKGHGYTSGVRWVTFDSNFPYRGSPYNNCGGSDQLGALILTALCPEYIPSWPRDARRDCGTCSCPQHVCLPMESYDNCITPFGTTHERKVQGPIYHLQLGVLDTGPNSCTLHLTQRG